MRKRKEQKKNRRYSSLWTISYIMICVCFVFHFFFCFFLFLVHRLCVVQLALADTVLRIITNHGILRFLRNNHQAVLESVTVRDLGVGVYRNLVTLTYNTPVIKALELLSVYKVSSIPIVNEYNMPVDVYTRADVRYLALDHTWTNLDMTIEESLGKHKRGRVLPLCMRDDSIMTVRYNIISTYTHSYEYKHTFFYPFIFQEYIELAHIHLFFDLVSYVFSFCVD